ncbi:hypothetical protein JCM5296_005579 [Sporobolomyces johnsonii]
MMRAPTLLVRSFAPARSVGALRTVSAIRPTPSVFSSVPASSASRLLSTTALVATKASVAKPSSAAAKAKERKAVEAARKASNAARRAKNAAKKESERARKALEKERALAARIKKKEKELAQKARAKAAAERAKEKAKAVVKKPRTTLVLKPPKMPSSTWGIFFTEFVNARKRELGEGEKLPSGPILTKEAAPLYHALDPSARAELERRAQEEKAAYPAILEAWKQTLTPAMIKDENAVRATRRRLGLSRQKPFHLGSEPKKALTPFILFSSEVRARGVDSEILKGETNFLAQSPLLAQAWRSMTAEQKQPYYEAYHADKARYVKEKAEFDAALEQSASA